jgi:hypothetical protein
LIPDDFQRLPELVSIIVGFRVRHAPESTGTRGKQRRKRCWITEIQWVIRWAVMKEDLAGGNLPSKLFRANAAWWAIMLLAYNLNNAMKRLVLGGVTGSDAGPVTVGPASRAFGSCHRAFDLCEDNPGTLAAINQHTATFGYRVLTKSCTGQEGRALARPSWRTAIHLVREQDA